MTAEVKTLFAGDVTPRVEVAMRTLGVAIANAIDAAKDAHIPQGLIVAMLHGYAHQQTVFMLEESEQ